MAEPSADLSAELLAFLEQRGFDLEAFRGLQASIRAHGEPPHPWLEEPFDAPHPDEVAPLPPPGSAESKRLTAVGEQALAEGALACVVYAGGAATRFGGGAKAAVEVLPGHTFLSWKIEQARAIGRRFGRPVPVCVMTSHLTHAALQRHLADLRLEGPDVHLFEQGVSVRLTPAGEVYRDASGAPSLYPTGHGGFFEAFARAGLHRALRAQGVRSVFISNVDNLGASVDPVLLGLHLSTADDAPLTAEVVQRQRDAAASVVRVAGRLRLVEGFRMPPTTDLSRLPNIGINNLWLSLRAFDGPLPMRSHLVKKQLGKDTVLQFEQITCEVTEHLKVQCVRVPREGRPGHFRDGRFYPVKAQADLESLRPKLRLTLLREAFEQVFPHSPPELVVHTVRGRISLFGNFTDLGGGAGVTAALDRGLTGVFQRAVDAKVVLHSAQANHPAVVDLRALPITDEVRRLADRGDWTAYVASSVATLHAWASARGQTLGGLRGCFTSDLPVGSGMSSSAALELLVLRALADVNGLTLDAKTLADLAQAAESVLAPTGKLDQYAIAFGEAGRVNLFDAKQETSTAFAAELPGYGWVQVFTEPRALVHARYGRRKEELVEARDAFRRLLGQPDLVLADVTPEQLAAHAQALPSDEARKRAQHLIEDHRRALEVAMEVLPRGDLARLGQLMNDADQSYHQLLEVGTPMMAAVSQAAAELRREHPGLHFYAAASGGGDGGPVNLVGPSDQMPALVEEVLRRVEHRTGKRGTPYPVTFATGMERSEL